jgi:hypothetical protein
VMTAKRFASLGPRDRGFVVCMMGSRNDEPHVPDEDNPYQVGSAEAVAWDAGAWGAYLEVLDGEE